MKVDLPSLTRFLKAAHPLKKVSVRFIDEPSGGHLGWAKQKPDGSWTVQVCRKVCEQAQVFVILHEFAHVRAGIGADPHDERWGRAYSEIYKMFLEWNDT